jgi:hypothetical protein
MLAVGFVYTYIMLGKFPSIASMSDFYQKKGLTFVKRFLIASFFFFLAVQEIEPRVSHLLGQALYHLRDTTGPFVCIFIFLEIGSY